MLLTYCNKSIGENQIQFLHVSECIRLAIWHHCVPVCFVKRDDDLSRAVRELNDEETQNVSGNIQINIYYQ